MKPPASLAEHVRTAAALIEQGQAKAAERVLKAVLREDPNRADALVTLGVLCGMRGQLGEAVKHLSRAARQRPDDDAAHYNLGQALIRQGRHEDAAKALERAAELANRPEIHEKLGDCLVRLGRLDEAVGRFSRALSAEPRGLAGGQEAMLLSSLIETKRRICDWAGLKDLEQRLASRIRAGFAGEPLLMLYVADDPELHRINAIQYARDFLGPMLAPALPATPFSHVPRQRQRIRIGYLCSDFRNHATARLIAGVIEAHDRTTFEVFGLSIGRDDGSPMRRRMRAAFDRFVDLKGLAAAESARRIHALGIDVLIDVNGYIADSQPAILAARPAPVQCHYLAFPGTLGGDFIDYMIVDPVIVPHSDNSHYTEALVRLPECYQANDDKRMAVAATPSREDCGLPSSGFVYCAFNNAIKISPDTFDVWMRILKSVPGSVLWLFRDNAWQEDRLRSEAEARGVDGQRLVFAGYADPEQHLARMRIADLFIDTFPYTGHTTASDALWVGLPVLTRPGRTFASRVGASLLRAAGVAELIMEAEEAFEREAIALGSDPHRLTAIRSQLDSNRGSCPLFDTQRFTRHLEAAYAGMWERWRSGRKPAAFDVTAGNDQP